MRNRIFFMCSFVDLSADKRMHKIQKKAGAAMRMARNVFTLHEAGHSMRHSFKGSKDSKHSDAHGTDRLDLLYRRPFLEACFTWIQKMASVSNRETHSDAHSADRLQGLQVSGPVHSSRHTFDTRHTQHHALKGVCSDSL